ncbi:MAG: hypothetical protein RL220_888 [Bacteroidota bacterium]
MFALALILALFMNGVNLKTVTDCMGHTTIQHTLKYLNHVDELKDEAVLKLRII